MNICIIGDGLTSLSLAKILINKKINVHIYKKTENSNLPWGRTIGIAKNNFLFINIFIPVKIRLKGISNEISPKD